MAPTPTFATPPPSSTAYILSYPAPYTLLLTINRPRQMNSLPYAAHWEADAILAWFDAEPALRVCVVTGAGDKAFCAGQDLIEQRDIGAATAAGRPPPRQMTKHPFSGFGAISRREGKKPIIAAVNGFALGGGFELCLGCDLVVASPRATFGLPEASRGIYAAAGGLARLVRLTGLPIASEVALAARVLTAQDALQHQVINRVSKTHESVVDEALELAGRITQLSPDAVIVTRSGLRAALEEASVERAAQRTDERFGAALREGDNVRIGLEAFANKKKPQWVASKL